MVHELEHFSLHPIAKDTSPFDRGWQDGIDRHVATTDFFGQHFDDECAAIQGFAESPESAMSRRHEEPVPHFHTPLEPSIL